MYHRMLDRINLRLCSSTGQFHTTTGMQLVSFTALHCWNSYLQRGGAITTVYTESRHSYTVQGI